MTRRLYYEDGYRTEFAATLCELLPLADDRFAVFLDETYFYPTSGGQPHDLGRLAELDVIDVQEHERGIAHVVASRPEQPIGVQVRGSIDGTRRRAHREQHSGQHILSRAFEEQLGLPTQSARLGDSYNSIDLECVALAREDFERVFARANAIVREARPVHVRMIDPQEAASASLRKKSERSGILRVVEVEGFDRCPCGGTHVRNSGEVGLIVPLRLENLARGVRVQFLCGARGLEHLLRRDRLLSELSLRFTSGAEELGTRFEKIGEENKQLQRQVAELSAAALREQALGWISQARSVRQREREFRLLVQELDASLAERIHGAQRLLLGQPDLLSVLLLLGEQRAQIVLCAGPACEVDCAALLREWLQDLGKGGGRGDQARGSLDAADLPALRARIDRSFAAAS